MTATAGRADDAATTAVDTPAGITPPATPPSPAAPKVTAYAARLSRRRIVVTTVAVIGGMFLAALDATVVATAMPTVIAKLHGVRQYAWVFSAYLLTETVTIPVWGKVADMAGRKRTFLAGMAVFLLGSALSGQAHSMDALIAFRAIQGIGAGCLLPVAQVIVGDLFTLEQRVKVQGIFSAVFGFASVVGPFVGGYLTDHLSWRWVFYVNLPVGLLAAALVIGVLVEPLQERIAHSVDWLGIVTLAGCTGLLVFALELIGQGEPWRSGSVLGCLTASVALLVAFLTWERRAAEPLLPLELFANPVLRAGALTSGLIGMTMYGVISFLPTFMQFVLGSSATNAGRILTPLMLGNIGASLVGGRVLLRTSYRLVFGVGMVLAAIGLVLLTQLGLHSTSLEVSRDMFVIGLGMGLVMVTAILAAQNSVTTARMGVATSSINFTRQIGGAIGVAVAGAVFISGLLSRMRALLPTAHLTRDALLTPRPSQALPPALANGIHRAFAGALHQTFLTCALVGVLAVVCIVFVPGGKATDIRDRALASGGGESAPD